MIEDELALQDLVAKILTKNGYVVLCASNEEQTFGIFDREKCDFRMVFSDVVLPGASGVELVRKLLARKPDLKVLMTSGYTDYKAQRGEIDDLQFPFIEKPYNIPKLLAAIKTILHPAK